MDVYATELESWGYTYLKLKGVHADPFMCTHFTNQIIKYGGFENVARRLQLGFKS